jgi:hypothetical protein
MEAWKIMVLLGGRRDDDAHVGRRAIGRHAPPVGHRRYRPISGMKKQPAGCFQVLAGSGSPPYGCFVVYVDVPHRETS